ncbi:MAG: 3-isopropylmalate dehydratase large subunit [Candidatus Bathyarchaeia archaeon]|jgi:3-isopropylmalate/(R)-2-methylmalate dehydratase large subunit
MTGHTISEKILAAHSGVDSVKAGEVVKARVDACMINDATGVLAVRALKDMGKKQVWNSGRVIVVLDHVSPACTIQSAKVHRELRAFSREQGISHHFDVGEGVCHQLVPEYGMVKPGDLFVGADSHTCTYGAFGAFATGVGSTDAGAALAFGKLWFKVPETIRVDITGTLPDFITSKDVILRVAKLLGVDGATYAALEFRGKAVTDMSVSSRMTLCNMAIEVGAKAGICEPDEKTYEWLREDTDENTAPITADEDAIYKYTLDVPISGLEPQVACPHNVDNVKSIQEVEHIKVDQVFLGSCTNGRLEDLEMALRILKGRKIAPDVRMLVVPASKQVYLEAEKRGVLRELMEAGAVVSNPSCAACFGGSIGLLAPGEVGLATSNRNFKGRQGSPESEVYLSSPFVAAASALTGHITDPRKV